MCNYTGYFSLHKYKRKSIEMFKQQSLKSSISQFYYCYYSHIRLMAKKISQLEERTIWWNFHQNPRGITFPHLQSPFTVPTQILLFLTAPNKYVIKSLKKRRKICWSRIICSVLCLKVKNTLYLSYTNVNSSCEMLS